MNITNVIISYYIEVLNAMLSVYNLSLAYVLCFHPLHFILAQALHVFVHSCFALITALGSAVSCFQIIYVVNFDWLFSMDPQAVGWRTFMTLGVLIFSINAAMGIYFTYHGLHIEKAMAALTLQEVDSGGFGVLFIHSMCWALLFCF